MQSALCEWNSGINFVRITYFSCCVQYFCNFSILNFLGYSTFIVAASFKVHNIHDLRLEDKIQLAIPVVLTLLGPGLTFYSENLSGPTEVMS